MTAASPTTPPLMALLQEEGILTQRMAARLAGVDPRTIRRAIRRGDTLPALFFQGHWIIRKADLERWMEEERGRRGGVWPPIGRPRKIKAPGAHGGEATAAEDLTP